MWPARSTPLTSEDAGKPQPSISPIQGTRGTVGKHFPTHAAKPCGLGPAFPPWSQTQAGAFTYRRSASPPSLGVLASGEPAFLHLILHLVPHFSFCCPNTFSPPGLLPNNPPPNYFSLVGPGAATSVPKFCISRAISAQSGAASRVISRRATSHP